MRKYFIWILLAVGLIFGLLTTFYGIAAFLAVMAVAVVCGIILSDYERATYILGAYSVIDFALRSFSDFLGGIWDELFLILLIALWGFKWVLYRKEEGFKMTPLDLPVFIFITAMVFVLIVNSPDFSISLEGFRAVVQYVLWYFIVIQLLRTEKGARNLCILFTLVCFTLALHGVYQYIIGVEMPAGWVDSKEAGVRTRVYSILGSPNVFGSLMTLATPIAISFVFSMRRLKSKVFFAFVSFVMALSLLFTFSRGAWIGFMVAAFLYVLIKDKRFLIPIIIGAVFLIAFVPSVSNRITYMLSSEYIESSLRGGRLVRWLTGIDIVKANPFVGVGHGHFGGAVAMNHGLSYLVGINVHKTFYMDNYFLKTAVETGLLGLSAFIVLIYQLIINCVRTIRITFDKSLKELEIGIFAGLIGVICHNFVENIFEVPMMTSCFWTLTAVMMHLWYLNYKKKQFRVQMPVK